MNREKEWRLFVKYDKTIYRRKPTTTTTTPRNRNRNEIHYLFVLWVLLLLPYHANGFLTRHGSFREQHQPVRSFQTCRATSSQTRRDEHNDEYQHYDDNGEQYSFWEDPITDTSFNSDLQNIVDDDVQKAQDALEVMEDLYQKDPTNEFYILPTAACYTTVIQGWVHSDHPDAAKKAQALLDAMEERIVNRAVQLGNASAEDEQKWLSLYQPNEVTYLLVCQKWADDRTYDFTGESARRAEAILYRMRERGMASGRVWSTVIDAWTKRAGKVPHAMDEAERLLHQMESGNATMSNPDDIHFRYRDPILPSVVTYTSVMTGLARSKERNLALRAETIFERMTENGVEADMVAFTALLNCWARCTTKYERKQACARALSILDEMERRYANDEYHVKPSPITYTTAIAAIGNSLDPKATDIAEQVLRRCYNLHESGAFPNVKPNTATFNSVIAVLSRMKGPDSFKQARRAEHLLVEMIKRYRDGGEPDVEPNVRTWGTVVLAWANCGQPDAAENAQRILDKLEDIYKKGETSVRPNVVCFTTLIRAWCRSGRKDGLERAEALLMQMEREYDESGDVNVRPNAISYITMMDGLVRRDERNGAMRAQETVNRMLSLYAKGKGHARPNRLVFNSLINAWSRSSEKGAALKAEKIFQWMESQSSKNDDAALRPDEVSFTGILNAWANQADQGGAERAQQILDHMLSLSPEERGFQPSIICHNIVIKAWGRSRSPRAVQNAEHILLRLEQERQINPTGSLRPDVTTYSSVINCCAYYAGPTGGQKEALDVAIRTFRKLCEESDESPNNITYGTLFKAIARLMPSNEDREELVQSLFAQCCQEGQVDAFVLSQVRNASSDRLYRKLVTTVCGKGEGVGSIDALLQKIPKEWSANLVVE